MGRYVTADLARPILGTPIPIQSVKVIRTTRIGIETLVDGVLREVPWANITSLTINRKHQTPKPGKPDKPPKPEPISKNERKAKTDENPGTKKSG